MRPKLRHHPEDDLAVIALAALAVFAAIASLALSAAAAILLNAVR